MSARARFSAVELKRAVNAMRKAGCIVAGARINPATGEIVVLTREGEAANDVVNPLDRLHRHA